jgi:hypothetical protein
MMGQEYRSQSDLSSILLPMEVQILRELRARFVDVQIPQGLGQKALL